MTEQASESQTTETGSGEETLSTESKPTETVDFWKQKAREQEKRAKENATAAQRLKEIEDAQKSAEERATEALTNAEKRAQEAESRALRLEVASEKGLTAAQAKRLVGGTREELEADADDLLENFKPPSGDTETQQPKTALDLDLGQRGTTAATGDPKADFARFLRNL
jgi:hypothetical protein